jgi:hypothetical protein
MYHARDHAGERPWRSFLLGAVSLTALLLCLCSGSASACVRGGPSCLPTTGYTYDNVWNCGTITVGDDCFSTGVLNTRTGARFDNWGWGSASYGGSGTLFICVDAVNFGGCGNNLARACAQASCAAQTSVNLYLWVENTESSFHTISGHGKS